MISRMQILDTLLGKQIVDALIRTLYTQDDDFPEIHQSYLAAIDTLNRVLGQDAKHSVQKYTAAIEQQCASNLFFAGVLGVQMNLEHFRNPMAPNCTCEQVDYDDYLRVDLCMKRLRSISNSLRRTCRLSCGRSVIPSSVSKLL